MSDNTQIFIAKLSQRVSEKDLASKFSKYGDIKGIQLRRGYAFIVSLVSNNKEYTDTKAAEKAVERMDRKELEGSRIVVEMARKLFS
jgi:RNA recognition motif-containing protein